MKNEFAAEASIDATPDDDSGGGGSRERSFRRGDDVIDERRSSPHTPGTLLGKQRLKRMIGLALLERRPEATTEMTPTILEMGRDGATEVLGTLNQTGQSFLLTLIRGPLMLSGCSLR